MHCRRMKGFRLQFGLIVLIASLCASGLGCHNENKDLQCVVDYLKSMTCCWTAKVSQNDPLCEVWVDDPEELDDSEDDEAEFPKMCSPKSNPGSSKMQGRSCNLNFMFFAAAQTFNVTLLCPRHGSQTEVAWIPNFKPLHNIKLKPPYNLNVVNSSSIRTEFSWQTDHELLFDDKLLFEFKYNPVDEQPNTFQIKRLERRLTIESSNLKSDHFYEAQIRVKISNNTDSGYKSTWSEWSHVVKWKAKGPKAYGAFRIILIPTLVFTGILVVATILAIRHLSIKRSRVKKLHWLSIPDPGKFFYELNSTYGGNFQKWLGTTFPASFNSIEDLGTEISSVEISEIKDSESFIKQDYVSDSSGFKSIGNSSLSSFANQGYFWFSYPSSYEVDSCKVYFSYDRSGLGSGSEKSGSYRCLSSSNESLYESSQQYSPCSVFVKDLDHECFSAQTNASRNTWINEEMDSPPREPEDPSNVKPLKFSSELGNIGQMLRNDCPSTGGHGCLNSISEIPIFEASRYPFVSLEDITFKKKDEGVSRCGSDSLMFGDGQMGPLPSSTETVLSTQCPQDGFRQESTSIIKTTSLNLGMSSDAYLSLKEVQSKYSNQSI
ncbi:interleukin-2 receptor subunit beta-like isoform X2 [Heterodontus francisci]|uniref:interleukin-2 receptor subunit beta-like isoform X2 n=1 Tax=Heterodontus francisci TaxID=7792 RepID=UPI00355B1F2F